MKTLIVTASSKSKRNETDFDYKYTGKSFVNSVSENYSKKILDSRREIAEDLELELGPDLFEEGISESNENYLPAFLRYSGRTYSKISLDAWSRIIDNPNKFDCVILSALYGLIRYDEPIRKYEIKQVDKIPNRSPIKTFWKSQGAENWLFDYIKHNDIGNVKFVLSTSYSGIINRDKLMTRLDAELGVGNEDQQFKTSGMKSMLLRGQYINNLLLDSL